MRDEANLMRKFSDSELQAIKDGLNEGRIYCGISYDGYGTGYIYKFNNNNVRYSHYERGVVRNTISELRWLFENIFRDCIDIDEAIWSDYHINYIPLSPKYKAFDHCLTHPNVNGL